MRIIGGVHKGKKLHPPKGLPVRPTTDFAKEGLFNVLRHHIDIEGAEILDLCAGTGSISFEFASREAKSVIAIDQDYACIRHIKQSASNLSLNNIKAIKAELLKFINRLNGKFDIIFVDPPYEFEQIDILPGLLLEKEALKEGGLLILEHSSKHNFSETAHFSFSKKYGNVNFTFFEATTP